MMCALLLFYKYNKYSASYTVVGCLQNCTYDLLINWKLLADNGQACRVGVGELLGVCGCLVGDARGRELFKTAQQILNAALFTVLAVNTVKNSRLIANWKDIYSMYNSRSCSSKNMI